MVHELFHIDAHWEKYAPGNGHVRDRSFKVDQYFSGYPGLHRIVTKQAYGAYYTKVFARLQKLANGGQMVATNGNLPQQTSQPREK